MSIIPSGGQNENAIPNLKPDSNLRVVNLTENLDPALADLARNENTTSNDVGTFTFTSASDTDLVYADKTVSLLRNQNNFSPENTALYYPEDIGSYLGLNQGPKTAMRFRIFEPKGAQLRQKMSTAVDTYVNETQAAAQAIQSELASTRDDEFSVTGLFDAVGSVGEVVKTNLTSLKDKTGSILTDLSVSEVNKTKFDPQAKALGTIYLYTPPKLSQNYTITYQEENFTSTTRNLDVIAGLAGQRSAATMAEVGRQFGVGFIDGMVKSAAGNGQQTGLIKNLTKLAQPFGASETAKFINSKTASTPLQNFEYLFDRVARRKFDLTFKFYPKTRAEAKMVASIIAAYKYYAHPEVSEGERYLFFPSLFIIDHIIWDGETNSWKENLAFGKYKESVLTNIFVSYADSGSQSMLAKADTFSSDLNASLNMPVGVEIVLEFQELVILTRNDMQDPAKFHNPTQSDVRERYR